MWTKYRPREDPQDKPRTFLEDRDRFLAALESVEDPLALLDKFRVLACRVTMYGRRFNILRAAAVAQSDDGPEVHPLHMRRLARAGAPGDLPAAGGTLSDGERRARRDQHSPRTACMGA